MRKNCIIRNSSDINQLMEELSILSIQGKYIFRGYNQQEELLPTLFRRYITNNIYSSCKFSLLDYEGWLLKEFDKYSIQYLPPFSHPLDWIAAAQHFGLPTRLIDWSFDPFCALFFALSTNLNSKILYNKLLVINKENHIYSDNVPIYDPGYPLIDKYDNKLIVYYKYFCDCLLSSPEIKFRDGSYISNPNKVKFAQLFTNKNNKLFFFSLVGSNPRIIAQKGLFQIPMTLNFDYHKRQTLASCERVYFIDSSLKNRILDKLESMNIIVPRLFPDLQNICDYIKTRKPLVTK